MSQAQSAMRQARDNTIKQRRENDTFCRSVQLAFQITAAGAAAMRSELPETNQADG